MWWKWDCFREKCWDPCKYVLDSRYCHPDITDLQWVVVSQGWKTTTLSFLNPADRYSSEIQAYFCFQHKKIDWCLHLISLAFLFLFFITAIHTPGSGQSIGTRVLDFFGVLSEEHARSSFKSMHYFYLNYFITASHKDYSIIMACRSSKNLIDFCLFGTLFFFSCFFFVMYCLTLIHR